MENKRQTVLILTARKCEIFLHLFLGATFACAISLKMEHLSEFLLIREIVYFSLSALREKPLFVTLFSRANISRNTQVQYLTFWLLFVDAIQGQIPWIFVVLRVGIAAFFFFHSKSLVMETSIYQKISLKSSHTFQKLWKYILVNTGISVLFFQPDFSRKIFLALKK